MTTAAVILSGGKSRRMGRDKSELLFGGHTLLERAALEYQRVFDEVCVSVRQAGQFRVPAGCREITDFFPGAGPMAGLHAALKTTGADAVFLSAVDLPYAGGEAAAALMAALDGREACVLMKGGRPEPVFAAYSKSCLPALERLLEAGDYKMELLLNAVDTLRLYALPGFDVEKILMNINTPEDYAGLKSAQKGDIIPGEGK